MLIDVRELRAVRFDACDILCRLDKDPVGVPVALGGAAAIGITPLLSEVPVDGGKLVGVLLAVEAPPVEP